MKPHVPSLVRECRPSLLKCLFPYKFLYSGSTSSHKVCTSYCFCSKHRTSDSHFTVPSRLLLSLPEFPCISLYVTDELVYRGLVTLLERLPSFSPLLSFTSPDLVWSGLEGTSPSIQSFTESLLRRPKPLITSILTST